MDETILKSIAEQLRQPHGDYAVQVGEKMNEGNLYINKYTIEALNLTACDNILEIGMGNGFFVKEIVGSDNSIKYTGCDFSEKMVEEAEKNNERFNKTQATFYLANAEKLPFENAVFNKVFSVNTLYFWEDPALILSEMWRVLQPLGKIIISIRPKSIMQHYPFVKFGFSMYSKNDLENLLSSNNFRVLNIIEKSEPDQELNGLKMPVESLIISAEKV